MTSKELIQKIYLRLAKVKLLIFAIAAGLAVLLYLFAKQQPVVQTALATIYPLTASNDGPGGNNPLSAILGTSDASKNFSSEASINIVDLATSRTTREEVAMTRLPKFSNKTIAELLVESFNANRSYFTQPIEMPKTETDLRVVGGEFIRSGLEATVTKNGMLELRFSNTNPDIITPISFALIDKISQFYIDLKIKKANIDYNFTVAKMDSLQSVLNTYDRRAINMNNTTLFVAPGKIEYTIPKENLINDKTRVLAMRNASANNKEEALWRLQKARPIIQILDPPNPPFKKTASSGLMYGLVGFFLGLILGALLFCFDIIYKYINSEIKNAVFGEDEIDLEDEAVSSTIKVNPTTTTTRTTIIE